MNTLLHRLRDKGNTVLVVEHDTDVITAADHVVELGPRRGTDGGRVVYEGDVAGLAAAGTLTGEFLRPAGAGQADRAHADGRADAHERDGVQPARVDVDVPLGVLVAITGVAGSGKSPPGPGGAAAPAPRRDRRRPVARRHLDPLHAGDLDRGDGPRCASSTPRRTGSSPGCSASTPTAPAPPATAWGGVRGPGLPRRRPLHLPGLRGPPLHRRGAGPDRRRPVDLRHARPHRGRPPSTRSHSATSGAGCRRSSTSGWAT